MSVELAVSSAASAESVLVDEASLVNAGFDERWAAWKARGFQRDRVTRQRMAIGALAITTTVLAVSAWLLGRSL